MEEERDVFETIHKKYGEIFAAERKVADFILKNPETAVDYNVSELDEASGVSDATVIRMCKHIGYQGYYQMRIQLSRDIGRLRSDQSADPEKDGLDTLFERYIQRIQQLKDNNQEEMFLRAAERLANCKRVHIIAVGNTTPIAMYMGFRLERMGIRADYNQVPEYFINHIDLAEEGDIVFAITKSGSSRQIIQAMELAAEKKLPIITVTGEKYSPVSRFSECLLLSIKGGRGKKGYFQYEHAYEHLSEMAVVEALLDTYTEKYGKEDNDINRSEMIFSEYKL